MVVMMASEGCAHAVRMSEGLLVVVVLLLLHLLIMVIGQGR